MLSDPVFTQQTIVMPLEKCLAHLASHVNKGDAAEMSMLSDVTVTLFIFADEIKIE